MQFLPRGLVASLSALLSAMWSPHVTAVDLSALSLEELMDYEVVATPQFRGKAADLPASVSIITEHEIRAFGWRTLADVLRSLRGFNVTYDRIYSYAGVRGLSPPGDFKPRLQVLIDGTNITENIFGSVLIGGEFPLDLDLVQRIEVVRGPSASVFGGDAIGGVINIITRSGRVRQGVEAAATVASHDEYGARVTASGSRENGLAYVISATTSDAAGDTLHFPEMAALGGATSTDNDDERRKQFFTKLNYAGWQASLIHGAREKVVPTGAYGTLFDDPSHREDDTETLADLRHAFDLRKTDRLMLRVYYGRYDFEGVFPYADTFYYHNRDQSTGRWWGSEMRWQSRHWQGQHVTAGIEYRSNYRQDQFNDDIGLGCVGSLGVVSAEPCLDSRLRSEQWSLYGQDEIAMGRDTRLTLGLRFDRTPSGGDEWSPRIGLVQHTAAVGTFKLLYASAFRDPSVFELRYYLPGIPSANSTLEPEHVESLEANWEYAINRRTQLLMSLYQYRASDLILPDASGMYVNASALRGRGAEWEISHRGDSGTLLRASYAAQFPDMDGERPSNAPQHLIKLNVSSPLWAEAWRAAAESQTTSARKTESGNTLGGFTVVNLNIAYRSPQWPWDLELGVYNALDKRHQDPAAFDQYLDPAVVRDGYEQDGRTLRIKGTWHF